MMRIFVSTLFVCASMAVSTAAFAQREIDVPQAGQGTAKTVRVTLEQDHNYRSPPSLMEEVDTGDGPEWQFVCSSPCGVDVDPNKTFRVQGDSWRQLPNIYPDGTIAPGTHTAPDPVLASSSFHLPASPGEQTLSIKRGNKGTKLLGYIYAAIAVPLLALGGTAAGGGFGKDPQGALGIPLCLNGGVFGVVGVTLVLVVSTKVYGNDGRRIAKRGPALTPVGFVF
jgi:hypothetical protein